MRDGSTRRLRDRDREPCPARSLAKTRNLLPFRVPRTLRSTHAFLAEPGEPCEHATRDRPHVIAVTDDRIVHPATGLIVPREKGCEVRPHVRWPTPLESLLLFIAGVLESGLPGAVVREAVAVPLNIAPIDRRAEHPPDRLCADILVSVERTHVRARKPNEQKRCVVQRAAEAKVNALVPEAKLRPGVIRADDQRRIGRNDKTKTTRTTGQTQTRSRGAPNRRPPRDPEAAHWTPLPSSLNAGSS